MNYWNIYDLVPGISSPSMSSSIALASNEVSYEIFALSINKVS